jgi:hypothetical protein
MLVLIIDQAWKALMKFKRLLYKALGEKAGSTDSEADKVGFIRAIIVLIYIITNFVIIAGVIRHW